VVVLEELRRYRFAGAVELGAFLEPRVDALLNQYGSTTSSATQHSIIDKLQTIMVQQLPVIPVLEEVDWFQYNSDEYSGSRRQRTPTRSPACTTCRTGCRGTAPEAKKVINCRSESGDEVPSSPLVFCSLHCGQP